MSGDIYGSFELVREEEELPSSAPIPVLDTREVEQVLVWQEHKQVLHCVEWNGSLTEKPYRRGLSETCMRPFISAKLLHNNALL